MPKPLPQLLTAVGVGAILTIVLHWASRQPTHGVMRDTSQPVETLNPCLIVLAGLSTALTSLSLTPGRARRLLVWAIRYSISLPIIILLSPHWIPGFRWHRGFSAQFSADILLAMSLAIVLSPFVQRLLARFHCQPELDAWLATKKHWRHTIVVGSSIWFCFAVFVLYSEPGRPVSQLSQLVLSKIVFTQFGAMVAAYSLTVAIPWLLLAAYFCISYTGSEQATPNNKTMHGNCASPRLSH